MDSLFCWFSTVPDDDQYPMLDCCDICDMHLNKRRKSMMMCILPNNHKGAHRMELTPHKLDVIKEVINDSVTR